MHSVSTLRFIKFSIRDVLRIVDKQQAEKNPDLLKHIFSIPIGVKPPAPTPLPPSHPAKFLISKITGGLRITLAENVNLPVSLELQVAYDVRRGNAFKRYSSLDFTLMNGNIQKLVEGGQIAKTVENGIIAIANDKNFKLNITGFDERRDLRVNVKEGKT
jgi:hypothetical protein